MTLLNLASYEPVPGTSGDASQIANGFAAIQAWANGNIDRQNISAGVIGAKTSTTVAGLGTPNNGDIAVVRTGSTPFDFIGLVYDSTYGKWVSPAIPVADGHTIGSGASTSSATYVNYTALSAGNASLTMHRLPWKALNTAGLKWQFKWDAVVATQASQSAFGLRLTVYSADVGTTPAQDTTNIFGEDVTFTANATLARTSGWVDINPSLTVRDALSIMPQLKSDGTRNASLANPAPLTVWGRLVA